MKFEKDLRQIVHMRALTTMLQDNCQGISYQEEIGWYSAQPRNALIWAINSI